MTSSDQSCTSLFQHTAARRRLQAARAESAIWALFQHTAARRRLQVSAALLNGFVVFQHTAARRRLLAPPDGPGADEAVSTHSRPKAAARPHHANPMFATAVSTHSRPKAAATTPPKHFYLLCRFQHTAARRRLRMALSPSAAAATFQHTAARRRLHFLRDVYDLWLEVSTHSRPKAAAKFALHLHDFGGVSTHSRPKAAASPPMRSPARRLFQHTAARRRLRSPCASRGGSRHVSTHSRPKAAATAHAAHER